ncbi:MAG: hypothetical protein Aurels2KO_54270 [Aureliella sp.]
MRVTPSFFSTITFRSVFVCCVSFSCHLALAEEVTTRSILKLAWRSESGKLEVYDHSQTLTNVLAINAKGDILGLRESLDPKIALLNQQHFYSNSKRTVDLPKLPGYSNSEFQALSDDGKAVGYASRAPGNPAGALTAVVWDANSGRITDLGKLDNGTASQATDISSDGTRIVGYSTASNPPRVQPCVWTLNKDSDEWTVRALPAIHKNNPYLVSSGVVISPDGKKIAACPTYKVLPNNVFDSNLYIWTDNDGSWERSEISELAGRVKDINDSGVVALNPTTPDGVMPRVASAGGGVEEIELLPGDKSGRALAVAPSGDVYGYSDDPPGPEGGPVSFVYSGGKTSPLPVFAERGVYSSVNACNASGQLVGFVDIIFKGGRPRLPISAAELEKLEEDETTTFKTLGFRWTPSK